MQEKQTSRRQFLETLLLLLGSQAGAAFAGELSPKLGGKVAEIAKYKISPWKGDDFTRGHKMRDGEIPPLPKTAEKKVDFVIVGGGIAGLTSAFYLKDHDFLLLEQYDELGGQSRGGTYKGIDYSLGASYMSSIEGIFGELFSAIGIKPVTLSAERAWCTDWFSNYAKTSKDGRADLQKEFARLNEIYNSVRKLMEPGYEQLPQLDGDLAKLDSVTLASYLKDFSPQFLALLDSFLKAALCAGSQQVSALAGFDLVSDIFSDTYVFPGSNPAIAKALQSSIGHGDRFVGGAFVWQIDLKDDGASVAYSDKDGNVHRVDCRHVIVTAPPLVAARIMPGMEDQVKGELLSFKYGSYLVGNFCLRKKILDGPFDNWLASPFTCSDVAIAEKPYQLLGKYNPSMGSVLTAYHPYATGSEGRALLYVGDREQFASSLVDELSKLSSQLLENLDEVVLSRWGHAMVIFSPQTFSRLAKIEQAQTGPYTLAHNSMMGTPSAESAILAARRAADRALGVRAKAARPFISVG